MDICKFKTLFISPVYRLAIVLVLASLFSFSVQAEPVEAGRVIFADGTVLAADQARNTRVLNKGDAVYSGDTVVTKSRSMAQLRMIDKGYISIRANSQFRIDKVKLGKDKEEDAGFFSLLKGGFRAITGIIGKRVKSSYRVKTAVATIGIRGTDYSARLCNDDCGTAVVPAGSQGAVPNGLYVGVLDGGVTLANKLGRLELEKLHYGFVKDAGSAPRALLNAPKFLFFKSRSPRIREDEDEKDTGTDADVEIKERSLIAPESDDALSSDRQNSDIGEIAGELDQDQIDSQNTITSTTEDGESLDDPAEQARRPVAVGVGPLGSDASVTAVRDNTPGTLTVDADGYVEGFASQLPAGTAQFAIGTAQNLDLGLDPVTGIRWGRWGNGIATVNGQNLDLNNSSLHWVSGPSIIGNIALPSSGTASYDLVGNTTPTDNFGNTGILGSATLNANFNNMTVNSNVNVGIDSHVWSGASTNMPINASGQYNGAMDVSVDSGQFTGSGNTSGFFTNNATGSGMTYSMDADVNGAPTSVSGAAVFRKQ